MSIPHSSIATATLDGSSTSVCSVPVPCHRCEETSSHLLALELQHDKILSRNEGLEKRNQAQAYALEVAEEHIKHAYEHIAELEGKLRDASGRTKIAEKLLQEIRQGSPGSLEQPSCLHYRAVDDNDCASERHIEERSAYMSQFLLRQIDLMRAAREKAMGAHRRDSMHTIEDSSSSPLALENQHRPPSWQSRIEPLEKQSQPGGSLGHDTSVMVSK